MAEYNSFSGVDITAVFGDKVFGELQMVSYKSDREKAPVYTMGSPDPRTIARGKRLVTGVCVFTVFDKDTLIDDMSSQINKAVYLGKDETANFGRTGYASAQARQVALAGGSLGVDTTLNLDANGNVSGEGLQEALKTPTRANLADQLLAFDISLVGANEYGKVSKMIIHGVELMTESGGVSIDDLVIEKQMSFIAKRITPWTPVA